MVSAELRYASSSTKHAKSFRMLGFTTCRWKLKHGWRRNGPVPRHPAKVSSARYVSPSMPLRSEISRIIPGEPDRILSSASLHHQGLLLAKTKIMAVAEGAVL